MANKPNKTIEDHKRDHAAAKANKLLNLIEQYMTRGSITESQALALLRQYGLN